VGLSLCWSIDYGVLDYNRPQGFQYFSSLPVLHYLQGDTLH
jgi:hypothetical protein